MANNYFQFKQFTIRQDRCAMKVTTDACLFGAWVANEIKNNVDQSENLLDVGTGTGLLSLMIAEKNPKLFIDAIEIDPGACKQADENRLGSRWHKQINSIEADARNFSSAMQYDFIVSNPPFYENELNSENIKKNLAHHSSELSFDDLPGLINKMLKQSGAFYILMPYKRKTEIEELIKSHRLYLSKKVYVRQSVNHDFFRIMLAGKKEKHLHTEESEISIWNEKKQYTTEFVKYLKDYYLYL